jgi:hypothetical protein
VDGGCPRPWIKRVHTRLRGGHRTLFEQRGIGYVFAVGADFRITTSGGVKMRAEQALQLVEPRGWNRRSCGNGSKGWRLYDWAWIATAPNATNC